MEDAYQKRPKLNAKRGHIIPETTSIAPSQGQNDRIHNSTFIPDTGAIDNRSCSRKRTKKISDNIPTSSVEPTIDYCKPEKIAKLDLITPKPLRNHQGYCFFNSVLQILRGCLEFTDEIVKYHHSDNVAKSEGSDHDKIFVNYFCKLIYEMTIEEYDHDKVPFNKHKETLQKVHELFKQSKDGDDVQKCFMLVLTTINNVTRSVGDKKIEVIDKADAAFLKKKDKNSGFVFDLFYGQFCYSTICKTCHHVLNESFQLFKSLPLPVIETPTDDVDLLTCIQAFLQSSDIVMDEKMNCLCPGGSDNLYSQCEITHAPTYLFIYLTRGSYYADDVKNNSFVKCDTHIFLPTKSGKVEYRLISTIEHIGGNEGGHYYCKCNYERNVWWLINDEQIENLGSSFPEIISRHVTALMFKRIVLRLSSTLSI